MHGRADGGVRACVRRPRAAAAFGAAAAVGALVRPELYLSRCRCCCRGRAGIALVPGARDAQCGAVHAALYWCRGRGSRLRNGTSGASFPTRREPRAAASSPIRWCWRRNCSCRRRSWHGSQAVALAASARGSRRPGNGARSYSRRRSGLPRWGMLALPLAYAPTTSRCSRAIWLLIYGGGVRRRMDVTAVAVAVVGRTPAGVGQCRQRLASRSPIQHGTIYARVVIPPSRAFSEDLQVNMVGLARWLHDHAQSRPPTSAISRSTWLPRTDLGGLASRRGMGGTVRLRGHRSSADCIGVRGYPHVDYPSRACGQPLRRTNVNGHRFEKVYVTTVRNPAFAVRAVLLHALSHYTGDAVTRLCNPDLPASISRDDMPGPPAPGIWPSARRHMMMRRFLEVTAPEGARQACARHRLGLIT